jgi:Flp pilus assembly protein TadD
MSWWSRLIGGRSDSESKPQRLDYLKEAIALERQGDYDAALTSYRLALRDRPDDVKVLLNMAIAYTRTARHEEAIRSYKRALEIEPNHSGALYGLAFLLLRRGETATATAYLEAFLASPAPKAEERYVEHARRTLQELRNPPRSSQESPRSQELET